MKKIYFGSMLVMALAFTACNNDYQQNYTNTFASLNVITNQSDGTTVVREGSYMFDYTITNTSNYGSIATSDLNLGTAVYSFSTPSTVYQTNGSDAYFKNLTSSNGSATNATFLVAPSYVPGMSANVYPYKDALTGSYTFNENYKVVVLPRVPCYTGKTHTIYPGNDGFDTETIKYQVLIDVKETPNTASIIMYDAKFSDSEREPLKAQIIIEGLTVDYSDGIHVYGQDIIPLVPDGNETTPVPGFTINSIDYHTSGADMTYCTIDYMVGGIYQGSFMGRCIYSEF